ncbi:SAM-dependent methyltransferase [Amycolatopsis sp. NPDC004378]
MVFSAPVSRDFDGPSVARVSHALLGGHDHYEADRAVLEDIFRIAPESTVVAKEARQWLVRAVRLLTDQFGIDQFLDLGSGLPTEANVHEVAQRCNPEAHVVYVDNDPVVQAYCRALLMDNERIQVSGHDLRDVDGTLTDDVIRACLDLDRPVGLIMSAIIHHIADDHEAERIVRAYVDAVVPGSYLVLLHMHDPADGSKTSQQAESVQRSLAGAGLDTRFRASERIMAYFDGLELVEPGLVHPHQWWPDGPRLLSLSAAHRLSLCGVARIP